MKTCIRWVISSIAFLLLVACAPSQAGRPSVIISSPGNAAQFRVGEDIAIQSVSSDAQGIARVELLVDGQSVKIDPSPTGNAQRQFTTIQVWKATTPGSHLILVRATNAFNEVGEAGINITVVGEVGANPTNTSVPGATETLAASTPTLTHTPASVNVTNTAPRATSTSAPPPPPATITRTAAPPNTNTPAPTRTRTPTGTPTGPPPTSIEIRKLQDLSASQTGHVVATCPSGTKVTGGGYVSVASPFVRVLKSVMEGNGWAVDVLNNLSTTIGFFTSAICVSNLTGTIVQVAKQENVLSQSTGAQVDCPTDTILTGGGFATTIHTLEYQSRPIRYAGAPARYAWNFGGFHDGTPNQQISVFALCLTGVRADALVVEQTSLVESGKTGLADALCPADRIATGGGFYHNIANGIDFFATVMQANGWRASFRNNTPFSTGIMAYAVCLKF